MTRRDQILRVWIERNSPADPYTSCISYKGKVHRRVSTTRIRRAAKEFATLHILDFFTPKPAHIPEHQPELFN